MTITVDTGNITVATPQANVGSPQTFAHTCAADVDGLVVVITIYDTSSSDGVVSGVKYNNVSFDSPAATIYYDSLCDGHVSVWLLPNPDTGDSYDVEVTFGGTVSDFEAAAVGIKSSIGTFDKDSNGTPATGTTGNLTITWDTVAEDTIAFSASLDDQADAAKVHPQETQIYNVDVGDVVSAQYAIRSSSGSQTMTVVDDDGDEDWVIVGAAFYEILGTPQVNISDGLTVGESTTPQMVDETLSVSDGVTLVDTPQYYIDDILINEIVSVSVSEVGVPDREVSVSDGLTVGEITTSELPDALTLSVSDGLTLGEIVTAEFDDETIDVTDGLTIGEITTSELPDALTVDITDGLTVGDTPSLALDDEILSVSDGITVGETGIDVVIGALPDRDISVTDGLTIGEVTTSELPDALSVDVSDGITIGENVTTTLDDEVVSVSDGITVGDDPTVSRQEATPRTISVTDGLTIGDTPTATLDDEVVSVSDGLNIGDVVIDVNVGEITEHDLSVTDGITIGEPTTTEITTSIDVSDDVTVGEIVTTALDDLVFSTTDSITFGEITSAQLDDEVVSVSDGVTIGESVDPELVSLLSVFDNITITDIPWFWPDNIYIGEWVSVQVVDVTEARTVSVSDGLTLEEITSAEISDLQVSVTDDIAVGENVTFAVSTSAINVSDGVTVGDSVTISLDDLTFSVSDGVTVADAVTVQVIDVGPDLDISVVSGLTIGESVEMYQFAAIIEAWTLHSRSTAWTLEDRDLDWDLLTRGTGWTLEDRDLDLSVRDRSTAWTLEDR
jgi:hypothetical protein